MKNLNEKRMPFILFMVAFIGCVSLFVACSSETDNVINEDKQEEVSVVGTRGASDLPVGKVVASVSGNRFRFSWNSVLDNCDWGQSISLYSSSLGTSIAGYGDRYPSKIMDKEIEIDSRYIGKPWGKLTVVMTACGKRIEFPLTDQGPSHYGELMVCKHNFNSRESYIVIRGTNNGADIETSLSRGGKMIVQAVVKYPTGLQDDTESREFVKNINSGNQTTHFGWSWNNSSTMYMGTLFITVRIYDRSCVNLPTDNCNNYIEKTISWSIANSHGNYDFSGYLDVIGG